MNSIELRKSPKRAVCMSSGKFSSRYLCREIRRVSFLLLLSILILFSFSACGGGGAEQSDGGMPLDRVEELPVTEPLAASERLNIDASAGRVALPFAGTTGSDGQVTLNYEVIQATSMQVVISSGSTFATLEFRGPQGVLLRADDPPLQTTALALDTLVNSLPFPTKPSVTPLEAGTYQQRVFFPNAMSNDFVATVHAKFDSSPNNGLLRLNVHLMGAFVTSDDVRGAISSAVQVMEQIYARAGISLQVNYLQYPSQIASLPSPLLGAALYQELSSAPNALSPALNIFLGEGLDSGVGVGTTAEFDGVLGLSSAIPGPVENTVKSASVIGVLAHAGPDASLDGAETRVLGETMAHEAGHYLGLFHPVEIRSSDSFTGRDPLGDTPICRSEQECVDKGIAANPMFPRPVRNIPQDSFTSQQAEVLNYQVLVD